MPRELHPQEKALFHMISEGRTAFSLSVIELINTNYYRNHELTLDCKNADNQSLLFTALMAGDHQIVSRLLTLQSERDDIIFAVERSGNTLFHAAVYGGNLRAVKVLFESISNKKKLMAQLFKPNRNGNTVLHIVTIIEAYAAQAILDFILEQAFDYLHQHPSVENYDHYQLFINQKNRNGSTALNETCTKNYFGMSKSLMMYGADWAIKNKKRETAFAHCPIATLEYLLSNVSIIGKEIPAKLRFKTKAGKVKIFNVRQRWIQLGKLYDFVALDCTINGQSLEQIEGLAGVAEPQQALAKLKCMYERKRTQVIKHCQIALFLNPGLLNVREFLRLAKPEMVIVPLPHLDIEQTTARRRTLLASRQADLILFNRLHKNVNTHLVQLRTNTLKTVLADSLRNRGYQRLCQLACFISILTGATGMFVRATNSKTPSLLDDPVFIVMMMLEFFGCVLIPLLAFGDVCADYLDQHKQGEWQLVQDDLQGLIRSDFLTFLVTNNLVHAFIENNDANSGLRALTTELDVAVLAQDNLREKMYSLTMELNKFKLPDQVAASVSLANHSATLFNQIEIVIDQDKGKEPEEETELAEQVEADIKHLEDIADRTKSTSSQHRYTYELDTVAECEPCISKKGR